MADPLTLQLVEVEVVKEAIKFLYGQAAEAIKRWREHKDEANTSAEVPTKNAVPTIFAGQVQRPVIHLDEVGPLENQIKPVLATLSAYKDGVEDVTADNPHLLESVDALRRMMETIYQQRLTLLGEDREQSGPFVKGSARAETVAGGLAGVEAAEIGGGTVIGDADVGHVEAGGQAAGVKVKRIG